MPKDEHDQQILSASLVELNIRAGAMVVAMSLWHSESPKPDIHDLQQQVMSTWPVEAIGKADTQVKVLSGMIENLQVNEQDTQGSENADNTGETAEKR
ncbi:Bacteriophage lambda minor tail protein (GpG) [compost metagenome]